MYFVDFNLAKKLKGKGYIGDGNIGEYAGFYYIDEGEPNICHNNVDNSDIAEDEYLRPTISQVLKWLREEYSIHISTNPYPCEDGLMWLYEIRKFSEHIIAVVANKTGFTKEEQAAIAGIEYCLYNLI